MRAASSAARTAFRSGLLLGSVRVSDEFGEQLLARLFIAKNALDRLAEGRHVAERTLQGNQRFAQLEELVELGRLTHDGFGREVVQAVELQRNGHLAGIRRSLVNELVLDRH